MQSSTMDELVYVDDAKIREYISRKYKFILLIDKENINQFIHDMTDSYHDLKISDHEWRMFITYTDDYYLPASKGYGLYFRGFDTIVIRNQSFDVSYMIGFVILKYMPHKPIEIDLDFYKELMEGKL